jgi:hypothetical protein
MKTINVFFYFLVSILFSCSCNTSDNVNPTDYNFSITQSIQSIQELDNVTFSIDNLNNASITNITWFVNDVQMPNLSYELEKLFAMPGNFVIKAKIEYNSALSKTIEKNIYVVERPKHLVTIKKVEVMSYANDDNWYVSGLGYWVKLKFDIRELDESGSESIKYISSEDATNWNTGASMRYPKVWDISNANYTVKVYQTGNYYPNNQESYHTYISFQAAKSQQLVQQPYYEFNNLKLDLNPYRSLRPTTISLSNFDTQIRLTVEWN